MIEQRWLEREARRWNIDPVPADGVSRFVQLRTRLVRRASRRIEKVTETEIARYYSRHRPYFYQPELRDGVAILLLERSTAQRAKRELERGVAWATVARTLGAYAEPERLVGRTRADLAPALGRALFEAAPSVTTDPVRSPEGWYVAEPTRITPATRLTLEQSRDSIRQFLEQRRREHAAARYWRLLRERSRRETTCLAQRVPACRNGQADEFDTGGLSSGVTLAGPILPRVASVEPQ